MNFNQHLDLRDDHAFLSPSKHHWINYDQEKLSETYIKFRAIQRGTELHRLASDCIRLGVKLPKSKTTLNLFVNDAIGYRMKTEQTLFYSYNAFGTTDAISFKNGILRIHDLKTGVTQASMHQLEIYTALFCLEYRTEPSSIEIELRLYQLDAVLVHHPNAEDISAIMAKIVNFDKEIEKLKRDA